MERAHLPRDVCHDAVDAHADQPPRDIESIDRPHVNPQAVPMGMADQGTRRDGMMRMQGHTLQVYRSSQRVLGTSGTQQRASHTWCSGLQVSQEGVIERGDQDAVLLAAVSQTTDDSSNQGLRLRGGFQLKIHATGRRTHRQGF